MLERLTKSTQIPQENPIKKGIISKSLIAAILFIACPGDDIAAIAASTTPLTAQTQVAETILGLYWVDQRRKETNPK